MPAGSALEVDGPMSGSRDFVPVTHDEPCAICGKPDWCRRSADGAHECKRIHEAEVSGYKRLITTPGGHAVYRRTERRRVGVSRTGGPQKGGEQPVVRTDLAADDRKFQAALSSERRTAIAQQLGVSVAALDSIGIGSADNDDLKRLRAGGAWKDAHPRVVSSFAERDGTGAVVGFCFRTDHGRKGSPSGTVGAKRGLIVPTTLPTRPDPVLLVEGPSDVAACETLGLASVGRPSNTSGGTFIAQLLSQREVLVIGENDQKPTGNWPGREGAERLARYLATRWGQSVGWALPPDGHKDIRAYLKHLVANGLDPRQAQACREVGQRLLTSLVGTATDPQPLASPAAGRKDEAGAREETLCLCVEAGDHFFHDSENRTFVLVRERGVARTLSVRSRNFELLLNRRFYRRTGSGLPSTAKTEAIATLESLAMFEGPEEAVFIRIGEYMDNVVLDLCDEHWRVVVIGQDGWEVVSESPVRFRRTRGMLALPAPVPSGSINDLRPFINVGTEKDFVLVCAFILACFNPRGPFFALLVNGEPGSAKSTLCRLSRALIDPNKAPLRSEPKDDRDLAIAANNAWLIGLDNMSHVSERLSNALCRLATGGGFATRELYTDADEVIFDAMRPVMINGIGDIADRSDLIDRAVRLTLPTIPEHQRRTEKAIWSEFKDRQPAILGAFLDAVSAALRNQADVRFTRLPRMADSASWVVAAEPACPWAPGSFIAALDDQRRDADELVIDASPLANSVRDRVEQHGGLEGTATQILDLLSADADEKVLRHPHWPKRAATLGTRLREVAPNFRRLGVEVDFARNAGRRVITVRKVHEPPDLPSPPSLPSPATQEAALEGVGRGQAGPRDDGNLPFCDGKTASNDSDRSAQEGLKRGQVTAMTAMTANPSEPQREGGGPGMESDAAEDEGVR